MEVGLKIKSYLQKNGILSPFGHAGTSDDVTDQEPGQRHHRNGSRDIILTQKYSPAVPPD